LQERAKTVGEKMGGLHLSQLQAPKGFMKAACAAGALVESFAT